jgi:hypothetical protein
MLTKQIRELIEERMNDLPKIWEAEEKKNPSLASLLKGKDIDLTKRPK